MQGLALKNFYIKSEIEFRPSTVSEGGMFQYRSRFFLRNCSKANFVKTLTLLDSEKVGIIGTGFSTIPGDFEQGRQANCTEKLIKMVKKSKENSTLIR